MPPTPIAPGRLPFPPDDLTGGHVNDTDARSVLVTGASRGIGRAVAEAFVAAGERVATIHRGGELPDGVLGVRGDMRDTAAVDAAIGEIEEAHGPVEVLDRKSTRLNSSHVAISYAVFCLKKKKTPR